MRKSLLKLACYGESVLSFPATFMMVYVALSHDYGGLQVALGLNSDRAVWIIVFLAVAVLAVLLMCASFWLWGATTHYIHCCEGRESAKLCKQRLSVTAACSSTLCYLSMFVVIATIATRFECRDIIMVILAVGALVRLALMIGLFMLLSDLRRGEKDASKRRFQARYGARSF